MHSRIFEVQKEFVSDDDWYYFGYEDLDSLPSGIDGLQQTTNHKEDIEWLRDTLGDSQGIVWTENSFTLLDGFAENYFLRQFNSLKSKVEALDLKTFATNEDGGMALFEIRTNIEDRFGFYMYNNEIGFCSLDSFIRVADRNAKYFIGGIADYHY